MVTGQAQTGQVAQKAEASGRDRGGKFLGSGIDLGRDHHAHGNGLTLTGLALDGMVSLSRPLVREPGLVARWQSGDRAPSTCVSDNACFVPARRGEGISCLTAVREEKRRQRAAAAEAADGSAE